MQELTCKLINLKDDVKIDDGRVCDWVADKKATVVWFNVSKISFHKQKTCKQSSEFLLLNGVK